MNVRIPTIDFYKMKNHFKLLSLILAAIVCSGTIMVFAQGITENFEFGEMSNEKEYGERKISDALKTVMDETFRSNLIPFGLWFSDIDCL